MMYASHMFQPFRLKWLAQVDSNHRPRAYQARALTTWAMSQYLSISFSKDRLVEMMGFEPMTPCLQGRCSPSWATPPYVASQMNCASHMNSLRDELASPWSIATQYLGFAFSNLFALTLHLSYPSMPSIASILVNPKTHFIRFEDPSCKRSFKIEQRTQKISLSRLATNIVFVSADSP